ncbi:MAG: hypothetical protein KC593_07140, partial [Myxococcales bacterium]|nr:hypothetical protein [Myxococcales bacterium]
MRSTSPLFVACSLGLALSGCHGSSAPTTPALEDEGAPPPADLLVAPAGAYGSVILHEGAPYLFVSFAYVYEGSEPPAPAGPAPATVALLTPEGSCTAHVGEPVSLSTGECETSTTIARPLTGCAGPVARVARVQGAWPEGVRFMPLDEPENQAFTAASELTAPRHREQVAAWMGEEAIAGRPLQQAVSAHARLDAGADQLETSAASFLVGPSDPECDQQVEGRTASTLRRGGQVIPVPDLVQWQGVVTYRGHVAGILLGAPHMASLVTLGAGGT